MGELRDRALNHISLSPTAACCAWSSPNHSSHDGRGREPLRRSRSACSGRASTTAWRLAGSFPDRWLTCKPAPNGLAVRGLPQPHRRGAGRPGATRATMPMRWLADSKRETIAERRQALTVLDPAGTSDTSTGCSCIPACAPGPWTTRRCGSARPMTRCSTAIRATAWPDPAMTATPGHAADSRPSANERRRALLALPQPHPASDRAVAILRLAQRLGGAEVIPAGTTAPGWLGTGAARALLNALRVPVISTVCVFLRAQHLSLVRCASAPRRHRADGEPRSRCPAVNRITASGAPRARTPSRIRPRPQLGARRRAERSRAVCGDACRRLRGPEPLLAEAASAPSSPLRRSHLE